MNLLTLWTYPPDVRLVGASGVVYLMAGFWLSSYVLIDRRFSVGRRVFRSVGFTLIVLFPTSFEAQVSYRAHAIGFAVGAAYGAFHFWRKRLIFRVVEVWSRPDNQVRKRPTQWRRDGIVMRMDRDDRFYLAVKSRDRRFEGTFVVGVVTTGVFCRPGCPAPIPKRRNVRFFAVAAAAAEAGFRPCARCRPELSVETWPTTSRTVTRALRLMAEDAGAGVDQLAARLGVGPRHLHRLFVKHVGASPVVVRKTQRALFARRLLDETDLPVGQIAHCAGFPSVRRFNATMKETFRKPPPSSDADGEAPVRARCVSGCRGGLPTTGTRCSSSSRRGRFQDWSRSSLGCTRVPSRSMVTPG